MPQEIQLSSKRIGIIGCGHLGQAVALALLRHGVDKSNLFVSYSGNPETYKKLEGKGLAACVTPNDELIERSDIVFILIRPQDTLQLKGKFAKSKALVVSCMAAIPAALLSDILGTTAYRMMLSGPDAILSGQGVAAVWPHNEYLEQLPAAVDVKLLKIASEQELDVFTTGVCLTAAILQAEDASERQKAIERISKEYPLFSDLYAWASAAAPRIEDKAEKEAYITGMRTKKGITDAIITSLQQGNALDTALMAGLNRTREISLEIQQALKAD